jgi:hypothetical protein
MRELMEAQADYEDLLPTVENLHDGQDFAFTTILTPDFIERICEAEEAIERLQRELQAVRASLYAVQAGGVAR